MKAPPPPARPASTGAASTSPHRASRAGCADAFPIALLGAGLAGIGAAIRLLRAGIGSLVIFERAREVGESRRDSIDPGAACDGRFVDVRGDVQDRYNEGIRRRMRYTVWSSGGNSRYLSPDGSSHSPYRGFAFEYVLRARRFRPRDYVIARFDR